MCRENRLRNFLLLYSEDDSFHFWATAYMSDFGNRLIFQMALHYKQISHGRTNHQEQRLSYVCACSAVSYVMSSQNHSCGIRSCFTCNFNQVYGFEKKKFTKCIMIMIILLSIIQLRSLLSVLSIKYSIQNSSNWM